MTRTAAITVNRPREEVEQRWKASQEQDARFTSAPGDRGTEIRLQVEARHRAKAMDTLRHFKQLVETGVIARSEGTPEGESAERKLKQRPAQPLDDSELEKAGVS